MIFIHQRWFTKIVNHSVETFNFDIGNVHNLQLRVTLNHMSIRSSTHSHYQQLFQMFLFFSDSSSCFDTCDTILVVLVLILSTC